MPMVPCPECKVPTFRHHEPKAGAKHYRCKECAAKRRQREQREQQLRKACREKECVVTCGRPGCGKEIALQRAPRRSTTSHVCGGCLAKEAVAAATATCTECGEPWLRPIQNFGRLQFRCLDCRRGPADIVGGPAEVASDMMDTDEPALPSPAQGDAQPGGFLRRVRCTRSGCDDEACDEAMHDMATSGDD